MGNEEITGNRMIKVKRTHISNISLIPVCRVYITF